MCGAHVRGGESVGDMGGMCGVGCVGGHVREDVWGRVCDKACVGEHVGVRYEGRVCEGRMWVGGGMCEEGV